MALWSRAKLPLQSAWLASSPACTPALTHSPPIHVLPPAVYLVAPNGEFARLWPKDVSIALLSDAVARAVKE